MEAKDDINIKLFLWAMNHNISWNVNFHNEIRRLIHNEIVNLNLKLDEAESEEIFDLKTFKYKKNILIDEFDVSLTLNSFLMQWSLLEEILYHCAKSYYPDDTIQLQKSSIQKYKPMVTAAIKDISGYTPWAVIVSAEKIRNCLLHINGRISLSRDCDWLRNVVKITPNYFREKNDRLAITNGYVNYFIDAARTLLNDLVQTKEM